MRKIVHQDDDIISIEHDGTITWDEIQDIKNKVWGLEAIAFEMYPAQSRVINKATMRHIWRVPEFLPVPDLDGGWD